MKRRVSEENDSAIKSLKSREDSNDESKYKKFKKIKYSQLENNPFFETNFDIKHKNVQLEDEVFFITEGYQKYINNFKAKYPRAFTKYMPKNATPKNQIYHCTVEKIEYFFINEIDFYTKIRLKSIKNNPKMKIDVILFSFSNDYQSFLILKSLYEHSEKYVNSLKLNDKINAYISENYDEVPMEFRIVKINSNKIWESVTCKLDDSEHIISFWDIIHEIELKTNFNVKKESIYYQKLNQFYQSLDENTIENLSSTSKIFPYQINLSIILKRLKNHYYRCINSFKFDFEHFLKISNSYIDEYKQLSKIFKDIFEIDQDDISDEEHEDFECDCIKECNMNCINVISRIECPLNCKNKENCKNQNFKRKLNKKVEIKQTTDKGNGMFAMESIPKNSFIIEYSGFMINEESFEEKKEKLLKDNTTHLNFYFMRIKKNLVIDASINGSDAKYINHSCNPNCETQYWIVDNQQRIGIFSIRDIKIGEELSYDYRGGFGQKCYCQSEKCRGVL
eukprot:gene4302-7658_t